MCTKNSIRIQEIIEGYNLKKIIKSMNIHQIITTLHRKARQVVVGFIKVEVGVITSFALTLT